MLLKPYYCPHHTHYTSKLHRQCFNNCSLHQNICNMCTVALRLAVCVVYRYKLLPISMYVHDHSLLLLMLQKPLTTKVLFKAYHLAAIYILVHTCCVTWCTPHMMFLCDHCSMDRGYQHHSSPQHGRRGFHRCQLVGLLSPQHIYQYK